MQYKITIIFLILIILYLFFAYGRIYNIIGSIGLGIPEGVQTFVLNTNGNKSLKYVALGDSLTAGVGSSNALNTLVYQNAMRLAKSGDKVTVDNLSVPGATTAELIRDQLPNAAIENPDFVTLFIGVNDIHNGVTVSAFSVHLEQIIQSLQYKTKAQILVYNLPYLGSNSLIYFPYNLLLDFQTQQYNNAISYLTQKYQVKLIDLYSVSKKPFANDPAFYSQDMFHPSEKGYLLWGQLLDEHPGLMP